MISYFYKSEIESDTYLKLYLKLKKSIGEFEEGDTEAKITGIYYIYNESGELMYIGQSKNIASRLTTHIRGKYRHSDKIIIEIVESCELDDVERFMIGRLKPIDNIRIDEPHQIEKTDWSEQFLELSSDGKTEIFNFSDIESFQTNNPRTIIYPTRGIIQSVDFIPELYGFISVIDSIDTEIIDRIIGAVREKNGRA